MGILTVWNPCLPCMYNSGERGLPGPSWRKTVVFSVPFGFCNSGDGEGDSWHLGKAGHTLILKVHSKNHLGSKFKQSCIYKNTSL
jgi:hypothetical protein